MNRLEQLHEFYSEDPLDPFNLYTLALEYQKTDKIMAREFFNQLLKEHEDYIPAYYHAGSLLIELNELEEAAVVLQKGITIAKQKNELKAMRELTMLLDEAL